MKRLLILGAALCSLSACAPPQRFDMSEFQRCAALHRGEPRMGQCQYALSAAAGGASLSQADSLELIGAGLRMIGAANPNPQYSFAPPPMPTRTVCTRQPWGMNCITQ